MRISAQRGEFESRFHGFKSEGIYLNGIEQELPALLAGKVVINLRDQAVASELPRVPSRVKAESFGRGAGGVPGSGAATWKSGRGVENIGNFDQRIIRIAERLLQIARELRAQRTDCAG